MDCKLCGANLDGQDACDNLPLKDTNDVASICSDCYERNKAFQKCRCGSGLERFALTDCHGIFLRYVCDKCEEKVKATYNPFVFSGYSQSMMDEYSGERIEPEEN